MTHTHTCCCQRLVPVSVTHTHMLLSMTGPSLCDPPPPHTHAVVNDWSQSLRQICRSPSLQSVQQLAGIGVHCLRAASCTQYCTTEGILAQLRQHVPAKAQNTIRKSVLHILPQQGVECWLGVDLDPDVQMISVSMCRDSASTAVMSTLCIFPLSPFFPS